MEHIADAPAEDGLVALDELYDYVYDKVRTATPNQTPGKWTFGVQGGLVIARRARPVTAPAPLPPELQEAADSPLATVRAAAVQELSRMLGGNHAGRALAAQLALKRLTEDDSRSVAAAALTAQTPPAEAAVIPPETAAPGHGRPDGQEEPAVPEDSPAPAAAKPERDAATIPSALTGGTAAQPAAHPVLRRAWIAVAAIGIIVAAGVYLLVGRGGGGPAGAGGGGPVRGGGGGHTHAAVPAPTLPGCTHGPARLTSLTKVRPHFVRVGGRPFDVVTHGNFGFVSLRQGNPLVVMNTAKPVPLATSRFLFRVLMLRARQSPAAGDTCWSPVAAG